MSLGPDEIRHVFIGLITFILSVAVHEFGHAFVADRLGDPLPRSQGRVTLNPIAHIDPVGTLLLPILGGLFGSGFAWGKPVMVQPHAMTRKLRMRTAHLLVALAGPVMNVLFAGVITVVLVILYRAGAVAPGTELYQAISIAILRNFGLAVFNLIPAPPLDGSAILAGLLPESLQAPYRRLEPYGPFVLFAFVLIPQLAPVVVVPARFMWFWTCNLAGIPPL